MSRKYCDDTTDGIEDSVMRDLDPQQLAEDVVAKSLGGVRIELADTTMVDVARAGMIAALEWALHRTGLHLNEPLIHPVVLRDQIARLKADTPPEGS